MPEREQEEQVCPHCNRPITDQNRLISTSDGRTGCDGCIVNCRDCAAAIFSEDANEIDGEIYCQSCSFECDCCHEIHHMDESNITVDDDRICNECREDNYTYCARCDSLVYNEDTAEVVYEGNRGDSEWWCQNCIDHCNDIDWNDSEEVYEYRDNQRGAQMTQKRIQQEYLDADESRHRCPLCFKESRPCPDCLERQAKAAKKEELTLWVYDTGHCNYHDEFHNKFKRTVYRMKHEHPYLYYGIELEVLMQRAANKAEVVSNFIKATNGMFVSEYDRSVDNLGNGAEFISRPMSYKAWTNPKTIELLKKGIEVLKAAGAPIKQPDGCGLHIHMSRTFFEHNTEKSVDEIRADIDWIFQVFQPQIEQLSQRNYTRYCQSKKDKIKQFYPMINPVEGLNVEMKLKKGMLPSSADSHENHHYAIVLTPRTIETRTFKSTLDVDTIIAYIQFCRAIAHAARNMKITTKTTFDDIISCKDGDKLTDLIHKLKIDVTAKNKNEIEVQ